ncbi:MAG: RNA-binding protein [Conexivisphaerales archaeon]|jgi:translin
MKKAESLNKVLGSLSSSARTLEEAAFRREKILKDSRDVVADCSRAIVSIHTGDKESAKSLILKARQSLKVLKDASRGEMDRYLTSPETEYVEAETLLALAGRKPLLSAEELSVQPGSYVLGLLDAIGEAKRRLFDSIRQGDLDEAERLFKVMETLYISIKPLAVYDNIVPGLRRKLDVDRSILEDTRSMVTEETRRTKLLKMMRSLEKKMDAFKE